MANLTDTCTEKDLRNQNVNKLSTIPPAAILMHFIYITRHGGTLNIDTPSTKSSGMETDNRCQIANAGEMDFLALTSGRASTWVGCYWLGARA